MCPNPIRRCAVAILVPLAVLGVAGCEVGVEPAGPPDEVAIGPGYYYDEEYVDVGGVHHPRAYWYRDGHGWAHRDAVPHGAVAHDRAGFGYVHGAAPHGGVGHAGAGGHAGGGGGHGGGR